MDLAVKSLSVLVLEFVHVYKIRWHHCVCRNYQFTRYDLHCQSVRISQREFLMGFPTTNPDFGECKHSKWQSQQQELFLHDGFARSWTPVCQLFNFPEQHHHQQPRQHKISSSSSSTVAIDFHSPTDV